MEHLDNLLDAIKFADFPILCRLYDTTEFSGRDLIEGKEILIQRHLKVKYAHVKVLDFSNKDEIKDKKGFEYIMEHDNCVDDTFLIPSKYNASLKFIHRPGSWKRFVSISQVLQELPRFVLVCEETVATPANGIGKNIVIPDKTILEVVRKVSFDGTSFLECRDGKDTFSFRETDRVNFTEIEDEKMYHMYELVRLKLLPRPFQFQNVEPKDVINNDGLLNSNLLTVTEGPLELIRFVDVDVAVGWFRDNSKKTFKTCIIPSRLWPLIKLQPISFSEQNAKEEYIKRRYNKCLNSSFVERHLYQMQVDETQIIWLSSPDLYIRSYSGNCMFGVVPIDYFDSDTDEADDESKMYTYTFHYPPPLPERPSRQLDQDTPTMQIGKVKEKQTLFAKVHKELLKWFIPKRIPDNKDGTEKKVIGMTIQLQEKQSNTVEENIRKTENENQRCNETTEVSQYLHPDENRSLIAQSSKSTRRDSSSPNLSVSEAYSTTESDSSDSESSREYDYINPESIDMLKKTTNELLNDETYAGQGAITFNAENNNKIIPLNGKTENEEHVDGFGFVANQIHSSKSSKQDQVENETEETFYQYSVRETSECFKVCGLPEFSEKCKEHKLDGSFFRHFDFQVLKEEPFNLMSFHIVMIKKIVFEGWRPKV